MNNDPAQNSPPNVEIEKERTKRAELLFLVAGIPASFGAAALIIQPTWPVAMGVTAISAMATVISVALLKQK